MVNSTDYQTSINLFQFLENQIDFEPVQPIEVRKIESEINLRGYHVIPRLDSPIPLKSKRSNLKKAGKMDWMRKSFSTVNLLNLVDPISPIDSNPREERRRSSQIIESLKTSLFKPRTFRFSKLYVLPSY